MINCTFKYYTIYIIFFKKLVACYTGVSSDRSRLNRGSGNTIKLPLFLRVLVCDGKGSTSHWTNSMLSVSEKPSKIDDTSWTIAGNKNRSLVST